MDFIVENVVWFIVGGVVILMTVIGYLAERTDFASKKYSEKLANNETSKRNKKKEKKSKKNDELNKNVELNENVEIGIADAIKPVEKTPENVVETKDEEVLDELYAPLEKKDESSETVNDIPDELYAPLGNATNNIETDSATDVQQNNEVVLETPNVEQSEAISDDLNAPTNLASGPTNEEQTVETMPTVDNVETPIVQETLTDSSPVIEEVLPSPEISSEEKPLEEATAVLDVPQDNSVTAPQVLEMPTVQTEVETPKVEIVSEGTESVTPPVSESLEMIDNEQFNKIFPDDPVVINENHKDNQEGTVVDTTNPQTVETNKEDEDVWKF